MAGNALWIISSWAMKCDIHQYVKEHWNSKCEVCSTEAVLGSAQKGLLFSQVLEVIRKTSTETLGKSHSTLGGNWNWGINAGGSH